MVKKTETETKRKKAGASKKADKVKLVGCEEKGKRLDGSLCDKKCWAQSKKKRGEAQKKNRVRRVGLSLKSNKCVGLLLRTKQRRQG